MLDRAGNIVFPVFGEDPSTVDVAIGFAKAGIYVGPIAAGKKDPGSILGAGWPQKTSCDVMEVTDMFIGTPMGTGVFIHAGRSRLIIMDVDNPDEIPDEWWPFLDEAPFQSTRDNVPRKGHYFFTTDRPLGNSNGKTGRSWGEMRGVNGVVVTQPTLHEKAAEGGRYLIVRGGPVPVLPKCISDLLPDVSPSATKAQKQELAQFLSEKTSGRRLGSIEGPIRGFWKNVNDGGSRHLAAVEAACWLVREAAAGIYPARAAYDALREQFEIALNGDRKGMWNVEYQDIWCWAIGQLTDERIEQVKADHDVHEDVKVEPSDTPDAFEVYWPEKCGKDDTGCYIDNEGDIRHGAECPSLEKAEKSTHYPLLPDSFWERRPVLTHIRNCAHSYAAGADVSFHSTLARLAALLTPTIVVDTGIRPTRLNYFVAMMGGPGDGKSEGVRQAEILIPTPRGMEDFQYARPLGSGEGIAEMFMGWVGTGKDRSREQTKFNAHIYVGEGETLGRLQKNESNLIGPVLRDAWIGDQLGQTNASKDTTRFIRAGSYSFGMVMGFQPSSIGFLMEERAGGTPQRFIFTGVLDKGIPMERQRRMGPIPNIEHVFKKHDGWDGVMHLPDDVKDEIWVEHVKRKRGEVEVYDLDAHAPIHKARIAALLALLDLRIEITMEDWELANIVWNTNVAVRNVVEEDLNAELRKREDRAKQIEANKAVYVQAALEKAQEKKVNAAVKAMAEKIQRAVQDAGGELHLENVKGVQGIKKMFDAKKRESIPEALEFGSTYGLFEFDMTDEAQMKGRVWTKKATKKVDLEDPYEK